MWHKPLFRTYLSPGKSIYPSVGNRQSSSTFLRRLSFADICQCFLFHGRHRYPSRQTFVPVLFSLFFSCHYPSDLSVQSAGESEQRHFRRNINHRTGHQLLAVHLQISPLYSETGFPVHRKEHIAHSSFLPHLYRTIQTLSASLFIRPDRNMLSLHRHSHHPVR